MGGRMSWSLKFLIAAVVCFLFACLVGFIFAKLDVYHKVSFLTMLILGTSVKILLEVAPIVLVLISIVLKVSNK